VGDAAAVVEAAYGGNPWNWSLLVRWRGIINFIHRKNFDSSINKEEKKKYKKERHTQSTYRNRHRNNTSYSMVKVQQWACILQ